MLDASGLATEMGEKSVRKPKGFGNFEDAMKKLISVPKEQVDAKLAAAKKARAKERRKK